jgi:hypothetical protein
MAVKRRTLMKILEIYRACMKAQEELAQLVRHLKPEDRMPLCLQILMCFLINCDVLSPSQLIDLLKLREAVLCPGGKPYSTYANGKRVHDKKEIRKFQAMNRKFKREKIRELISVEKKIKAA